MLNKGAVLIARLHHFFLEPASLIPFVFLRVSFAAFSLGLCCSIYPYLNDLYSNDGYIQWLISDHLFSKDYVPNIHSLYRWSQHASTLTEPQVVQITFIVYVVCLISIGIGFFSNYFAFLAWFIHLLFSDTGTVYGYGVETFIHVLLFYFIFMPIDGKYSLTSRILKKKFSSLKTLQDQHVRARIFLRLLQLHLCIIYFDAGLAKMFGTHWWNGEAVWRSLTQFRFNTADLTWLSNVPVVLKVAGWSVIFIEAFYCILIWLRPTRRYFLAGIVCIHLCIGLLMGLYYFSAIMIIMNVAAFGFSPAVSEKINASLELSRPTKTS